MSKILSKGKNTALGHTKQKTTWQNQVVEIYIDF
jgi:hypothetical protein